jgi:hypothetical protein
MRIIIALCILAAGISFISPSAALAQRPPETIQEAKGIGLRFLEEIPGAIKNVWETQAVPVFLGMWNWTKNIWDTKIFPWLYDLWQQFWGIFGKEIQQRRPLIEQEFQQEKQQLKQEIEERIPQKGKTLWQHIKGLFGKNEKE